MPLRLPTALSGRLLRRALSTTAASRPQWAMTVGASPIDSPALGATVHLAEPPRASRLFVPAHLLRPRALAAHGEAMGMAGCDVRAVSADGFLLLNFFLDVTTTPVSRSHGTGQLLNLRYSAAAEVTRFVCNPASGELFRLPDVDGTNKSRAHHTFGLLTKARRGHGPPDRYAIAEILGEVKPSRSRCFLMRRFLSEAGEWENLRVLPSPLPLPLARLIKVEHPVVAYGGRLWWVDVSFGAVSMDPFSDRPELHFVELPKGMPGKAYLTPELRILSRYRRVGVSEGRLRYAEVSQFEPFLLRSFALDGNADGGRWTLEHEVALSPLWASGGYPWLPMREGLEGAPRICVIDPMNASLIHLAIGNHAVTVDMDRGKVIASALIFHGRGSFVSIDCFFQPFLLPPWLESSRIPSAGKQDNAKNKTLADVLIRSN